MRLGILKVAMMMGVLALLPIRTFADYRLYDHPYESVRGAALGSAFIPIADDAPSGLMNQPAALAKNNSITLEPIDLQYYGSTGFYEKANSSLVAGMDPTSKGLADQGQMDRFRTGANNHPGVPMSTGFSIFPTVGLPYMAAGVLLRTRYSVVGRDNGDVVYRNRHQLIPTAGIGLPLAHGILKLGYSIQWVNQVSGDSTITANDANPDYKAGLTEGSTMSHNMGLNLTLPYRYLPSFHLVARNIGGARFRGKSMVPSGATGVGEPADLPMNVDFAIGWIEKIGKRSAFNWFFQLRDLTSATSSSWGTRASLGVELGFSDAFFFRAGFGNGYPSAGVGFKLKEVSSLDFAWYSQEISTSFRGTQEQRYALQYKLRFF